MKYINMLLLSLMALGLYAQQSGEEPQKFSLQEAVSYALKYNQTLKNAQLDVVNAQNKIRETRAVGLPQVNAEGRLVYTPQIPMIGIPDPFSGSGAILEFPQGIDYALTSNITASQLLFDGGFLMGLQAAKEFEALSRLNVQRSEQETELNVVKAYCMVLVAEESIKLVDVSINTLQETEKTLRATYQAGLVEKTEADRISITYNNLVIQRKKMLDMKDITYYNLKLQMGVNPKLSIALTDDLSKLNEALKSGAEVPEAVDYNRRAEYRIVDQQIRLYTLDRKRYQYGYLPTLAAFVQHQQNAFNTQLSPLFNKFYPGTLMGLTISVPIFDGLTKSSRIQQARINIEMAENTKKQLENVIEMEVFASKTNYLRAKELVDQQIRNRELAEEVYQRVNTKYQNGLSSSLDVITADRDLKEAQQNYLQAVYDLIVARAELKKALGNVK